jgi:hypothetical protein
MKLSLSVLMVSLATLRVSLSGLMPSFSEFEAVNCKVMDEDDEETDGCTAGVGGDGNEAVDVSVLGTLRESMRV